MNLHTKLRRAAIALALCLAVSAPLFAEAQGEVALSEAQYKKLDTFEAHSITKADKLFAGGDYKAAAAEYNAFILEFDASIAIPYALLRKGRCLHHQKFQNEAVKEYQEILLYFPNATNYAAAAQYYIGLAYWQAGKEPEAMKAWAKLAKDEGYAKHRLAADAINHLAAYLKGKGQVAQAVQYFEKVAVEFRKKQPDAARQAIGEVVYYYIRTAPNEEKLRAFYKAVFTFNDRPAQILGDLEKDKSYWEQIRRRVGDYGRGFTDVQKAQRKAYYKYWADRMNGRFASWDDFQVSLARYRLYEEENREKWAERLDKQFKTGQTPGDWMRILKWIQLYAGHDKKVEEYYRKLDFGAMKPEQIIAALQAAFDKVGDKQMAASIFDRLPLGKLADKDKASLAYYLFDRSSEMATRTIAAIDEPDLREVMLLRFYHRKNDLENGQPQALKVTKIAQYAGEGWWKLGEMLARAGKYQEAIAPFQNSDTPPASLWQIATCYSKLGRLNAAVQQLAEIEGFYEKEAPKAAMAIANLYGQAKLRKKQAAKLRDLLKRYPGTSQASDAHHKLESMGERIGGGSSADG